MQWKLKVESEVRIVYVPEHGIFEVPRHVSRVDSFKNGKLGNARGWHGWQVRWPGFRRFFPDVRHGGCDGALTAAVLCVEREYPGPQSQCNPERGVRLVKQKPSSRKVTSYYVVVSHPVRGKAGRKLYVGTENTVNTDRIEQKMVEGHRIRQELIREHKIVTGKS